MLIVESWQMFGYFFLALITGAILDCAYFGGLWWTVRQLAQHPHPGVLVSASFLIRSALVIAAFYWLMDGRWEPLLFALAAFLVVRMAFTGALAKRS